MVVTAVMVVVRACGWQPRIGMVLMILRGVMGGGGGGG